MTGTTGQMRKRVAYCLKVFARFSQTFILNELIEHQRAGQAVDVLSIRRPNDTRFHRLLADFDSPLHYLSPASDRANDLWDAVSQAATLFPAAIETIGQNVDVSAAVLQQAIEAAVILKKQQIDHVHAHFGNVAAEVARIAAKLTGISYSFTAHARDIYHQNVDARRLHRKIADARFVVTVSQANVEFLSRQFPACREKIRTVYNGLDLDRFPLSSSLKRPRRMIAVGRLVEKKGFRDLVTACAILRDMQKESSGCDFRCDIIGTGPLHAELQQQIDQYGLKSVVQLLGSVPNEQVANRVARSRVFVAPCVVAADGDRDGLPTVLLESMALGTPCVATSVTGIPEAIRNEATGLLVPPNEPKQLAIAIQRLLTDDALWTRLRSTARSHVEQRFDARKNCEQLRLLFQGAESVMKRPVDVPFEASIP